MDYQLYSYYDLEQTHQNRMQGHYTPHPTSLGLAMPGFFHLQHSFGRPHSADPHMIYQQPPPPQSSSYMPILPSSGPVKRIDDQYMMKLDTHIPFIPCTPTLSATSGSSFNSNSPDSPIIGHHSYSSSIDSNYFINDQPSNIIESTGKYIKASYSHITNN